MDIFISSCINYFITTVPLQWYFNFFAPLPSLHRATAACLRGHAHMTSTKSSGFCILSLSVPIPRNLPSLGQIFTNPLPFMQTSYVHVPRGLPVYLAPSAPLFSCIVVPKQATLGWSSLYEVLSVWCPKLLEHNTEVL